MKDTYTLTQCLTHKWHNSPYNYILRNDASHPESAQVITLYLSALDTVMTLNGKKEKKRGGKRNPVKRQEKQCNECYIQLKYISRDKWVIFVLLKGRREKTHSTREERGRGRHCSLTESQVDVSIIDRVKVKVNTEKNEAKTTREKEKQKKRRREKAEETREARSAKTRQKEIESGKKEWKKEKGVAMGT